MITSILKIITPTIVRNNRTIDNSYYCSLGLTPPIVSYTIHIMILSVLQYSDIQLYCISQLNCNINNLIV